MYFFSPYMDVLGTSEKCLVLAGKLRISKRRYKVREKTLYRDVLEPFCVFTRLMFVYLTKQVQARSF